MKITVSDNSLQVAKDFEKQIQEQPQRVKTALGRTAEFLIGLIKQRTSKGIGSEGSQFPKYSTKSYFFNMGSIGNPKWETLKEGYKEYRTRKGRRTDIVDLNFSGKMLSNIIQRSTSSYAIIYFASKGEETKALFNQNKRRFFAIGNNEAKPIMNKFMETYNSLSKA